MSDEKAQERELVRRAKAGDGLAFAEIMQKNRSMVYGLALKMVRRDHDAEDIASQVFIKVDKALKKFDGRSSLSTWIYKITQNECRDYLRKVRAQRVLYEGDLREGADEFVEGSARAADPAPGAEAQAVRRDYLNKLMEHASDEERMLIWRKEVDGLTVSELAEETGMNENTIKVKIFRLRRKLNKVADRSGEPVPDFG